MRIKITDVLPNPFREIGAFPVRQDKVDVLKASIHETGFWDNVIVRAAPGQEGKYELAYGHSRLEALRQLASEHPKAKDFASINVPVKNLDNDMMAKIMARENMEEWSSSPQVEQETLSAIVRAYGRGELHLPEPNVKIGKHHLRYAPSFVCAGDVTEHAPLHPYTVDTLMAYLGWKRYRVESALSALALIEQGVAKEEDFEGLTHRDASMLAKQTRAALNAEGPDQAKLALQTAKDSIQGQKDSVERKAKAAVDDALDFQARRGKHQPSKPKKVPNINEFVTLVIPKFTEFYTKDTVEKLNALVANQDALEDGAYDMLLRNLRAHVNRTQGFIDKLTGDRKKMKTVNQGNAVELKLIT